MSHNAPLRSLPLLSLLLAGPLVGSHALGQSNVRPTPVIGKAPRAASGSNLDSREAEEALWVRLSTAPVLEEPEWTVDLDLHTVVLPNGDLSLPGERSVVRGGWDAALTRESGDRLFTVFLNSEASFYDWNAPAPIVGTTTDPFNDLYSTSLGALMSFEEDQQVGFFTGVELTLSGEDNADIQDSLSIGAVSGVRCRASEDLTISLGLAALTRLDDDAWVIPFFGFDWQLSQRLRLASEGARVLVEAALSETATATLAAEYEIRQFRLNDDSVVPEGVFQDDQINLTGELAWRTGDNITLAVGGGVVVWQESTFLDRDGSTLAEFESDPGLYGLVSLRFDI